MVKHIGLWKLKDPNAEEIKEKMKTDIEALVGVVPGLKSAEVGFGYSGYDVCLTAVVEDKAALDAYQIHPAHVQVKEYIGTVVTDRAVCDYEL